MSLLEARKTYKPFEYPWAYEFWKRQQQVHWLPEEVPLGEDCRDWAQKLSDHERNLLTQIFRFFTQADVEVQDCYHDKYGRVFKPTEIKMMLTAFSNMETVHIAAYSHLLDTIGNRLPQIQSKADHFGLVHENVIASSGALYQDTLSTLRQRIQVHGDMRNLQQPNNASKIRALLLAGIRSARLWRQLGGHRWQLVISRRKLLKELYPLMRNE